jgi:hypothetical protein
MTASEDRGQMWLHMHNPELIKGYGLLLLRKVSSLQNMLREQNIVIIQIISVTLGFYW